MEYTRVHFPPLREMSESFVAGSMSGFLVRACTCPLDVLKVRFQLQLEPIHQVSYSKEYMYVQGRKYVGYSATMSFTIATVPI